MTSVRLEPRHVDVGMRMDMLSLEFGWMTFRADDPDNEPLWTAGLGFAPFSNDLLIPGTPTSQHGRVLEQRSFTVARLVASRANIYPAWAFAFTQALWGRGLAGEYDDPAQLDLGAPETVIGEGLLWAARKPNPPQYAQALVTVYVEKLREADEKGVKLNAIYRIGFLRAAMQELEGPTISVLSDEAR